MPEITTRADALREYHTGAASDGAAQPDQDLSLGGHRAGDEVKHFDMTVGALAGNLDHVAGANEPGTGRVTVLLPDTAAWGAPAILSSGAVERYVGTMTKLLESLNDPDKYVRMTATPPFNLSGEVTLTVAYNNVYGMSDRSFGSGSGTVGDSNCYRAVMLKNVSAGSLTNVRRWIGLLGTTRVTSVTQLGASGAGTITVAGSLANWPLRGWCQIRQSGGTLREVVYYRKRSGSILTVPAYGRARLGTSAGAGAGTDIASPVPGIALANGGVMNSGVAGATIVNEETAPSAVTWNLAITQAAAINFGTLTAGQQAMLWVWREIDDQTPAAPACTVHVAGSFGSYTSMSRGMFRIQGQPGYAVYVGNDAVPDVNGDPADFQTSLPITIPVTPPVSGTKAVNVLTRYRNSYGLESQNSKYATFIVDSGGVEQYPALAAPLRLGLYLQPTGKLKVVSDYSGMGDDFAANKWRVWYSLAVPDPDVDTPSAEVLIGNGHLSWTSLTPLLAANAYNVAVVAYRTLDGSRSTALAGVVLVPAVPLAPEAV